MLRMPENGEKSDFQIFEPYINFSLKDMTEEEIINADIEDFGLVENAPLEAIKAFENYKEFKTNLKRAGAV